VELTGRPAFRRVVNTPIAKMAITIPINFPMSFSLAITVGSTVSQRVPREIPLRCSSRPRAVGGRNLSHDEGGKEVSER
jgi:hypothetical protein